MEEENVFTGKTVDEAIDEGLLTLGITFDEAEITVLEEGKKKIFGSVKAKVKVEKKRSGDDKTAEFVEGILKILGIDGKCEKVGEDDSFTFEIKSENTARVIGKRGDVLDAIQTLAGAYANIGKKEYKKVVVDCENYRSQREETLKTLARKLAKTAVESGRKLILEPMTPYERRIIHAELMDNPDVKTASEGKEPSRYVVVIPNNAEPGDKGMRYGERRGDRRREGGRDRKFGDRRRGDRRREGGERRQSSSGGAAKRGKKEIHFGTFLGNSNKIDTEE